MQRPICGFRVAITYGVYLCAGRVIATGPKKSIVLGETFLKQVVISTGASACFGFEVFMALAERLMDCLTRSWLNRLATFWF